MSTAKVCFQFPWELRLRYGTRKWVTCHFDRHPRRDSPPLAPRNLRPGEPEPLPAAWVPMWIWWRSGLVRNAQQLDGYGITDLQKLTFWVELFRGFRMRPTEREIIFLHSKQENYKRQLSVSKPSFQSPCGVPDLV